MVVVNLLAQDLCALAEEGGLLSLALVCLGNCGHIILCESLFDESNHSRKNL